MSVRNADAGAKNLAVSLLLCQFPVWNSPNGAKNRQIM